MGMLVMQRQENGHVDDEAVERYSLGDSSEEESARLEEATLRAEQALREESLWKA